MRTVLLLILSATVAEAGFGQKAVDLLNTLKSETEQKLSDATNEWNQQKTTFETQIAPNQERAAAMKERATTAEAERDGFSSKAKEAGEEAAAAQARHDVNIGDITAVNRVMKITEAQTLAQQQEIDNGIAAVELAKQKVSEMGSVPANLMQVLAPKMESDDFEQMYQAKKGTTSLLTKGGAAFTSSADVLKNKLDDLLDKMTTNRKDLIDDHTMYKNKRNNLAAGFRAQADEEKALAATRRNDQAQFQAKSDQAAAAMSKYNKIKNEELQAKQDNEDSKDQTHKNYKEAKLALEAEIKTYADAIGQANNILR